MNWQTLAIAIIAVALIIMSALGYSLSASGHYVKTTFNGSVLEHPAESVENAGHWLISTVITVLAFIVGAGVVVVGLIYKFH